MPIVTSKTAQDKVIETKEKGLLVMFCTISIIGIHTCSSFPRYLISSYDAVNLSLNFLWTPNPSGEISHFVVLHTIYLFLLQLGRVIKLEKSMTM